ncbi:hypothetical protein TNCV_2079081 [Trichonephila clavipes]|nr:hypothetical protein TNCV_2079081 [Trichonephila clavipes]
MRKTDHNRSSYILSFFPLLSVPTEVPQDAEMFAQSQSPSGLQQIFKATAGILSRSQKRAHSALVTVMRRATTLQSSFTEAFS